MLLLTLGSSIAQFECAEYEELASGKGSHGHQRVLKDLIDRGAVSGQARAHRRRLRKYRAEPSNKRTFTWLLNLTALELRG